MSRARGGSNRVSNLCLACGACNIKKGKQDIRDFLKQEPELLAHILTQAKTSLKDAAAVNATRWALFERLKAFRLPIECGSGGLTKYNRVTRGLEKTHWLQRVSAQTHRRHSSPKMFPLCTSKRLVLAIVRCAEWIVTGSHALGPSMPNWSRASRPAIWCER